MKVLFCNHTSDVSGAELSLLDLIAELAGRIIPMMACPPGPLAERAGALGIPVAILPPLSFGDAAALRNFGTIGYRVAYSTAILQRVVRLNSPDVIHALSMRAALPVSLLRLGKHTRRILALHDAVRPSRLQRALASIVARQFGTVVANSRYSADAWLKVAPRSPAIVVPPPTALAPYFAQRAEMLEARNHVAAPANRVVLAFVGQISPWKGLHTCVAILEELRSMGIAAHLLVAGDVVFRGQTRLDNRQYYEDLKQDIHLRALDASVTFLGRCADVSYVYRAADFVLVPSIAEPFGRVVIEAMASEAVVLATRVGGPADIIDPGCTGFLLDPLDPPAWAAQVVELMLDAKVRISVARAASRAATSYDVAVIAPRYLRAYSLAEAGN